MQLDTNAISATGNGWEVMRQMPLDHALRRANLAALLLADSHAKKTETIEGGIHTSRWHITTKPISLLGAPTC